MTTENEQPQEGPSSEDIISAYLEIVAETRRLPTYADFVSFGLNRDFVARQFGNMQRLNDYMRENHGDDLDAHFSALENIFSEERRLVPDENRRRYIITTAVGDCQADENFIESLRNFSKKMDAQIVIMPCESSTNSFENKTATFDHVFNSPEFMFVTEDVKLNDNISLCSIQVSAKQIKPITGLSRIGNREGSYVFASPKQFLEYIPSGNSRTKNYSIMTPGACTKPNYFSQVFVSKRLSYIAEHDHKIGAVIVELIDDKMFHFRQVQAAEDGSFIDLGTQYNPDGTTESVEMHVIMGDLHGVNCDVEAITAFTDQFKKFDIGSIFLHDIFDGISISHHVHTIAEKQSRVFEGLHDLEQELLETYYLVDDIDRALEPKNLYVVKSNHDEFLTRYLQEGRYVDDPQNHYLSLRIAPALFEDRDVLQSAFGVVLSGENPDDWIVPEHWEFLGRDASLRIGGVELASHGDKGMNGAKPSLASLEKIFGDCVIGHNHTAAIQRSVFRTGTMSKLNMKYNVGPSSWTPTNCLLYGNGQRQLVNFIGGSYYLDA
jgi:hypothetical protein